MVAGWIYPDAEGGSFRVIYEISKRLAARGHNVYVITKRVAAGMPSQEKMEGIHVYRYNTIAPRGPLFYISTQVNVIRIFRKLSSEIRFDIINYHHIVSAFAINLSIESRKIPKIFTFYIPYFLEYKDSSLFSLKKRNALRVFWINMISFFLRLMDKYSLSCANRVIILSQFVADQITRYFPSSLAKVVLIPAGVDTEMFTYGTTKDKVREKLRLPNDKFILLTIRRLVPRMGVENLIAAMSYVTKEEKDVMLIIGGKGYLESSFKKIVFESGMTEIIIFTGFIEENELPFYYQAADLFILPTRALEGFGIVTLEALASGTPVLGTPIGGTIEILKKLDRDLLFKDTTPLSMAKTILEFIRSPEKVNVMRPKCRQYILDNYQWDKIINRYEKVLYSVKRSF